MHTIVDNQYITDLSNLPKFFTDATTFSSLPSNQSYRPLVTSLNALDYWIGSGLNVQIFHWHIFLEFLLLLTLVYAVFNTIFKQSTGHEHPWVALAGTALFSLHTATAETINYIISRSDGFSTLMVLTGLVIYTRTSGLRRQWTMAPFVIGCLTKLTTLMLAPIIFIYSLLLEKPSMLVKEEQPAMSRASLRAISSSASLFILGAAIYWFARTMEANSWTPGGNYSAWIYLNTQPYVIWIYLKTFVIPSNLTADTDLDVIRQILAPKVLWGLLVIALMLALAWWASRQRRTLPIAFGILWFFVALIPTSSIIPLAEVMNHHRTFFPYIGLTMTTIWSAYLIFSWAFGDSPKQWSRWTSAAFLVSILAIHAWGTIQRNEVWDNDLSLWKDVTEKSPNNGRGLMNYGLALMARGDTEGAIDFFNRARSTLYGNHPYLFINLGIATNVLARTQQSEKLKEDAERYFLDAIKKGRSYPQTYYRYASFLNEQGRETTALQMVNKAIALSPGNKNALALRERLIQSESMTIEYAREVLEENPTPEGYLNLSLKYYNLGDYAACINASESALAIRPNYAQAYNNICSAHNQLGQFDLAIQACETALGLDPKYELATNNLQLARQQLNPETPRRRPATK